MSRYTLLIPALLSAFAAARAQGDLAYMPTKAPALTADDERISMHETDDPAMVELRFPADTYRVDLINAHGDLTDQFTPEETERFDVSELRTGTWTLRACTTHGYRVRRFVVHQREGRNWVVDAAPRRKKR
jgi:hypothetical protein